MNIEVNPMPRAPQPPSPAELEADAQARGDFTFLRRKKPQEAEILTSLLSVLIATVENENPGLPGAEKKKIVISRGEQALIDLIEIVKNFDFLPGSLENIGLTGLQKMAPYLDEAVEWAFQSIAPFTFSIPFLNWGSAPDPQEKPDLVKEAAAEALANEFTEEDFSHDDA